MDYAKLPLPSATITATNLGTGKAYQARSHKDGSACISEVPEGLYSVEASLTGFLHVKYFPVRITASETAKLSFWLPFGEIEEGGIGQESTVSGTLLSRGLPAEAAEICLLRVDTAAKSCTITNDLGEYALVVPPGAYDTEVRTKGGAVYKSRIDVSTPGIYRNRLSLETAGGRR
jgi:hypothetical protein